jgi:hypothetical protein
MFNPAAERAGFVKLLLIDPGRIDVSAGVRNCPQKLALS